MEDFLYSVEIRESISQDILARRKKYEVDSASKLREQSVFTVS